MLATEVLKTEHKAIKVMLDVLEAICNQLEKGEEVDPSHLEGVLDFLKTFADKCHHGKEENVLFPALEQAGVPREGGPIGVMLHEHSNGREYIEALAQGIEDYKKGNQNAVPTIVKKAREYILLMRSHIEKEDKVLFVIADQHLSAEKQKELVTEFDRIENEKIGVGKHEEFHKLIDHFETLYLKND